MSSLTISSPAASFGRFWLNCWL